MVGYQVFCLARLKHDVSTFRYWILTYWEIILIGWPLWPPVADARHAEYSTEEENPLYDLLEMIVMLKEKDSAKLDEDICVHIFTASAGMVGVCITVIGIFQVISTLRREDTLGDDLLAANAILYLVTTIMSYWALRTRKQRRHHTLERVIDILFLIALTFTTLVAGIITWAMTFTGG